MSSAVSRTVKLPDVSAPLPVTAIDAAAADAWSGMSQMQMMSSLPNAQYSASTYPPRLSINVRAAAVRLVPPSFRRPLVPSAVYDARNRYFAIVVLLGSGHYTSWPAA